MATPFDDISEAFEPIFSDSFSVRGKRNGRTIKGTFYGCVLDTGFSDPISEADAESVTRSYSITIRKGEWLERKPPQTGDRVEVGEMPDLKLAVSHVDSVAGDLWTFTAREVPS